jgi:putative endonuclease
MRAKDVLGRSGEQAAADYLEAEGFRILERNWRCADGEIDIVAVDRHTFVVCEVKTRSVA